MYKNLIQKRLTEAFSKDEKAEIKDEVKRLLNSSDLKDVISDIVTKEIKNNKELEDKTIEITRNVLTQLYKTLWVKRGFWQSMLKNKSA
jgi:hypothetical protein